MTLKPVTIHDSFLTQGELDFYMKMLEKWIDEHLYDYDAMTMKYKLDRLSENLENRIFLAEWMDSWFEQSEKTTECFDVCLQAAAALMERDPRF